MTEGEKVIFTADFNIQEALELSDQVAQVFKDLGLKCVNCVAATEETLKIAALYHNKDLDQILSELNKLVLFQITPKADQPPADN